MFCSSRAGAVFGCALTVMGLAGCGGSTKREQAGEGIWFVHATDPHIFVASARATAKPESDSGKKLQEHDEKALADLLQRIPALSESGVPPAFLLLTGNLGINPCAIPKTPPAQGAKPADAKACVDGVDPGERKNQIDKVAGLLEKSPVRDIYVVAGTEDVPPEDSGDVGLGYFNQFIDAGQAKIRDDKKDVQLHNLTRCYVSGAAVSSCYTDVPDSPYRLIGFPSYSFGKADSDADQAPQAKQFKTFHDLLDQARQDGKKVLVASHTPDIEDPATPSGSMWKINQKLRDDWNNLAASDQIAGVFAGHLHDSHKEAYRQPYAWSALPDHDAALRRLFLAPPLAELNQDGSPIQARGFSLVHLDKDAIRPLLYWYNPQTGIFTADPHPELQSRRAGQWRFAPALGWLWTLDLKDTPVERLAVLLIAVLTAFLTIVAVWQIPPAETAAAGNPTAGQAPPATVATSPFTTKFGLTVIAGLGGLVATEVTKALGNQTPSEDVKWYYIVWFILSFFVLLLLLNLLRGIAEAVRARVAILHYAPARTTLDPAANDWNRFKHWLNYWRSRIMGWLFSLEVPLLTFFDTFINLIQGKNQTITAVFAKAIKDDQANVVRSVDAVRRDLNDLIERRIMEKRLAAAANPPAPGGNPQPAPAVNPPPVAPDLPRVRVNISVLSADQSKVFYISRTPGSSCQEFSKRSMAWVCVFTGAIRWYKSTFATDQTIVLFDNSAGTIPDDDKKIKLSTHYEGRPGEDYKAFVMLPLPWPHRGVGTDYVKGAIHISFRQDQDFEFIWNAGALVEGQNEKTYPPPHPMLEGWCDPEVRAALRNAMAVLSELLRGFSEVIYKSYIEPQQLD